MRDPAGEDAEAVEPLGREHRFFHQLAVRAIHEDPDELLMLDEAITSLLADDPMAGEIAKLRLFAGQSVDEAAESLGMSRRTAFRHWTYARAFLQLRLQADDGKAAGK